MKVRKLNSLMVAIMAGSMLLSTAGCMGKFAVTNKVYSWNKKAANERWVNEFIFVGMAVILPVYSLTLLVDGIIFNSVEWWSGSNPVAAAGQQKRIMAADGSEAVLTMRSDGAIDVTAKAKDGKRSSFTLVRRDDAVLVLDDKGVPVAPVEI